MSFETSEHHKTLRPTRMKRDYTDAMKILRFLIKRNAFEGCIHLMSVETVEFADNSVSVHDAKNIGTAIIKNVAGQSVFRFSHKRNYMVVNTSTKIFKCEGEQISIYNQLLFQRLLAIAGRDQVELESGLCFKLISPPAFLFNKEGLMTTVNKPALPEALLFCICLIEEICSASDSGRRVKRFSRFTSIMLTMQMETMDKMPKLCLMAIPD